MAVIGGRDHEISGLRSELHRLQTAYSDLTAEAAASQDAVVEVGVTRAKAAGLESELHRLRTAYSDLTAEAAASKDAVVEVGVMRAKAAGLESDVVRLQTAYPDLVAKAAASDGAVAEARVMKDKVAALEADNAGLRQSERSQAQEIARLQQSLSSAREQDMPDATPLQEPDSASDSEEEPEEESEEESVEEAPKPMPKRKAQQVTAGAPGKAWGSLTSKRGSKTTSSRRNVAALTMPKLGSKPSGIVKRTGKSSAKKVESDAEAPESTAEQRKRRWRNMTTQERKAVDDAIWEKYMGSGSLYKPSVRAPTAPKTRKPHAGLANLANKSPSTRSFRKSTKPTRLRRRRTMNMVQTSWTSTIGWSMRSTPTSKPSSSGAIDSGSATGPSVRSTAR